MSVNNLSIALANVLSRKDGLSAAYMPDGVPLSVAEDLVRTANRLRPAREPFAVLVTTSDFDTSDGDCLRISPQSLLKYRLGDRLAVVVGRHPELASITSSFSEALSQSFPEGNAGDVLIEDIARQLVDQVLEPLDPESPDEWSKDAAVQLMTNCLLQLRAVHLAAGQGTQSWAARWFEHVRVGAEALHDVLSHLRRVRPQQSVAAAFHEYTYPSFGLPAPIDGLNLRANRGPVGKEVLQALSDWWGDQERIAESIALLKKASSDESDHPLSDIDWGGFDRRLASTDSLIETWTKTVVATPEQVLVFAQLGERDFFSPIPAGSGADSIRILDREGRPLGLGKTTSIAPFVARIEMEEEPQEFFSEYVTIEIPTNGVVSKSSFAESYVDIETSNSSVQWHGEIVVSELGALVAAGRFRVASSSNEPTTRPLVFGVSVALKSGDSLLGSVVPMSPAKLILVPSANSGLIALQMGNGGIPSKTLVVVAPDGSTSQSDSSRHWSGDLTSATAIHRVLCWGPGDDFVATHEGRRLSPFNDRSDLRITDITPQGIDEFEIADTSFTLHAPSDARIHFSPLIAAIDRQNSSTEELPPSDGSSLRGQYEHACVINAESNDWLYALGHMALPASDESTINDLTFHNGFLLPIEMVPAWDDTIGIEVPETLTSSEAAERFRAAFSRLDAFGLAADPELPIQARWPSRYPRRRLWGESRAALSEYLNAYTELVEYARELGNPSGVFWASYPFSISAWSFDPDVNGCVAVLLSPLHPLRLAWLAAAESTLWMAEDAANLAGTVQGFGFPVSGPSEHTERGLLAVPSDAGTSQTFLGWELMVSASNAGHRALSAPPRIAGTVAPGSAASGLNAASVTAALKNYRRMNPHVSTLTIDLSSQAPAPRLIEIDKAVVSTLGTWEKENGGHLPGGARILDSSHRRGPAPVDDVVSLIRKNDGLPVSWSRYVPVPGQTPVCNIRLLQDSGVRVKVRESKASGNGVISPIPLRRFDASVSRAESTGNPLTRPGLQGEFSDSPFGRALRCVENSPEIESKLFGAQLIDLNADWTVSGESMLSASSIAGMLADDPKNRMLWEWRPPILERSSTMPVLDRKPYVTVARIPVSFSEQLRTLLTKARGTEASDADVKALLSKLGSRGVGLSSLLAMGGTHTAGALGFYLGFALLDSIAKPDTFRFVLPIDASDSFLMALSGRDGHADIRQRADLLLVDVSGSALTLVPIEIKFYGLGSEVPSKVLPLPESAAFGEPLSQLESTVDLLRAIAQRQERARNHEEPFELALWSNGLAALAEAGARLTPQLAESPDDWRDRLGDIASGETPVVIGRPLVVYFNHDAAFSNGERFKVFERHFSDSTSGIEEFGALVSDSSTAFAAVDGDVPDLVSEWARLVDWAVSLPPEASISEDLSVGIEQVLEPEPEPAQVPEPEPEPAQVPEYELEYELEHEPEPHSSPASSVDAGQGPVVKEQDGFSPEGVRFGVGRLKAVVGNSEADFWPGNTQLNQMNIGVVGDLGTGKTQLLKTLVYRLRSEAARTQPNPLSFLIFDYKRDFQEESFVEAVGGTVLRPQKIPLNFFALSGGFTPHKAVLRASMFSDVIGKIYGGVGPIQRQNLIKAIVNGYAGPDHTPPTLSEVLADYEAMVARPDAVSSILTNFVMAEIFSDDKAELVPFEELIDDKVLIVALSDLGVDQEGKNALVVLFLNMYYDYMLKATKWPFTGKSPQVRRLNSFLLVDEATNIMSYDFPVLMHLMLQGREFGFGTILASQYLSHFRTSRENYGEPLLTWFIHKVPNVTSKELSQLGIKGLADGTETQIGQLKVHEALYSSLGYSGAFIAGTPFYQLVAEDRE